MDRDDRAAWRSALMVASTGIELVVAIAVGWAAGSWLDEQLGTAPWLMFALLACGVAAGFRGVWRTAKRHWPKDGP